MKRYRPGLVLVAGATVVTGLLAGCGSTKPIKPNAPIVLAAKLTQVTQVEVTVNNVVHQSNIPIPFGTSSTSTLIQSADNSWSVGDSSQAEALALWLSDEDSVVPLPAYGQFTAKHLDPMFGLDKPQIVYCVTATTRTCVVVGNQTYDGEGLYAQIQGQPSTVFVITRNVGSLLISVGIRQPFSLPLGCYEAAKVRLAENLNNQYANQAQKSGQSQIQVEANATTTSTSLDPWYTASVTGSTVPPIGATTVPSTTTTTVAGAVDTTTTTTTTTPAPDTTTTAPAGPADQSTTTTTVPCETPGGA